MKECNQSLLLGGANSHAVGHHLQVPDNILSEIRILGRVALHSFILVNFRF